MAKVLSVRLEDLLRVHLVNTSRQGMLSGQVAALQAIIQMGEVRAAENGLDSGCKGAKWAAGRLSTKNLSKRKAWLETEGRDLLPCRLACGKVK